MTSRKKVMVNILNEGEVSAGWESSIYEWMGKKTDKYEFNLFFPVSRPIPSNRNGIVRDFLKGDWDYLVMLDDDNPCHKNIFDLLDLDLPVVAGVYPGKDNKRGIIFFATLYDEKAKVFRQMPLDRREGLQKVDGIGTGLTVIRRDVLEKMRKAGIRAPFADTYDKDGVLAYSDDFSFCLKCRKLGIDIYAHFDYIGSHWKMVDLLWVANLVAYAAQTGKTSFPDAGSDITKNS